jgi:hypothetical protein
MTERPSDPDLDPSSARDDELAALLRAAWSPGDLDGARNRKLIELALEDPMAPPTAEEIVESERLRRALDGEIDHPDLALARALRAAVHPADPPAGRVLPAPPAAAAPGANVVPFQRDRAPRTRRVYAAVGAVAGLAALAASALLFVVPAEKRSAPGATLASAPDLPELSVARSTQELFTEKFETGETSARVDRIAEVRARELRSNRYALWGVR